MGADIAAEVVPTGMLIAEEANTEANFITGTNEADVITGMNEAA